MLAVTTPSSPALLAPRGHFMGEVRRLLVLTSLLRELMLGARSYRVGRWASGAMVVFYGLSLLAGSGGIATLDRALGLLGWVAVLQAFGFFRASEPGTRALQDLARLNGASTTRLLMAEALARAALPFKPLAIAGLILWACLAWHQRSSWSAAQLLLGFLISLLAIALFSVGLAGVSYLGQRLAPRRPGSTSFALVAIPALLDSSVPELPSLWHAFAHWTQSSLTWVGSP